MKMHYSHKLILAIVIAGAATAVFYRSFATGAETDYTLQEFLATQPVAVDSPPPGKPRLASVADMLAGLELRLQVGDGKVEDWLLLAKSYYHLGRQPQAREAYDRAVAMGYDGDWAPLPSIDSSARFAVEIDPARYSVEVR